MGSCWYRLFNKPNSQIRSITQELIPLKPSAHTSNDYKFLYFPYFLEMESDIAYAISKGKNLESLRSRLQQCSDNINAYTSKLSFEDRLIGIESQLELEKEGCYVCLEVQQVQLQNPVKNLSITVFSSDGSQLKSMVKQRVEKSHTFEINMCVTAFVPNQGEVIMQVEDLFATIQVEEIANELAILDVVNLRKEGSFDPLGQMSVRVECVSKVLEWKSKNRKLLQIRQKQIQKLLEIEDQTKLESSSRIFLMSQRSDRGVSRTSYYREDESGQVNFYI